MAYTALYRKFRPGEFGEVKGQDHIVTTLKNQIRTDRIGHAYLFCGTRGTGKTTIAKIFAKAVNCLHPVDGNPCNECEVCKKINKQTSMNVIEFDAASNNGVASIRDIVEEVQYSPAEGKYKVYIIDEVHMLSTGAFNALLKTLEEPPSYVIFILATTEPHKIPVTILSRCQRYDFKRITIDVIADRLKDLADREGVVAEQKALRYIAKVADGSMRDALSLLDQCIAFYIGEELTYDRALSVLGAVDTVVYSQMFKNITRQDVVSCIKVIDDIMMQGRDLGQFISELIWYIRGLMLIDADEKGVELLDVSSEQRAIMLEEAKTVDVNTLIRYIRILSELSNQIRYSTQKRALLEITVVKLLRPQMDSPQDMTTILDRIKILEKRVEDGVVVSDNTAKTVEKEEIKEEKKQITVEDIEKLKKALPDDINYVVEHWNSIIEEMGNPASTYLKSARGKLSENNNLLILFQGEMSYKYFLVDDSRELNRLVEIISKRIGKKVIIETKCLKDENKNDSGGIDIFSMINFPVEQK